MLSSPLCHCLRCHRGCCYYCFQKGDTIYFLGSDEQPEAMLLLSYSSFFKEGDQTVRDQEMCVVKHTAGLWQSQEVHTDIVERI